MTQTKADEPASLTPGWLRVAKTDVFGKAASERSGTMRLRVWAYNLG